MLRSYLYVPGDDLVKLTKALARGADALIVDLEDGVAFDNKEVARSVVSEFLAGKESSWPSIWVRLNPGALLTADLKAIPISKLDGVVLAKTDSASDLDNLVSELGDRSDVPVMALVESGFGVTNILDVVNHESVSLLQVGEADLAADLGITPDSHSSQFNYVRQQAVVACAAAKISAPIAPVSTNFRDLELFRETTQSLADMGYFGRACIHPAQIEIVNAVFTPTPEQLEKALDTMSRYEAALASGSGVCLDADGRLVDEAIIRSARRVIANQR
jgi:citrate lyase subunit beta / citryl-CoA lyase